MSNSEKQSKATKFLASYSCWDYKFNKKIREKFKKVSKNFLTNDNLIDYDFVMKATNKAKKVYYSYWIAMFIIMLVILKNIHNIYLYSHLSIEELLYGDFKTPNESIITILSMFFISWIITLIYDFSRYKRIHSILDDTELNRIDISNYRIPKDEQNICIFSGIKPFIGSGKIYKNSSFVLVIDKAKISMMNDTSIIDFSEDEIYEFIQTSLSKNYSNINQKLYINGSLLNNDTNLLYAINKGNLAKKFWEEYSKQNNNAIRRYICITNVSESEEVQTSFFIRFSKQQNNTLFVEITATILPPVSSLYRIIEQLPKKISFARFILISQTAIFLSIYNLFKSLVYGLKFIFTIKERIFAKKIIQIQIEENPLFDYGEKSTLREDISNTSFETFYNFMDEQQLSKQIEKSFFTNFIKFLDSKNIDTFELTQQETTIINHGLIMSGGEFNAENMAIGKKSSVFGAKK